MSLSYIDLQLQIFFIFSALDTPDKLEYVFHPVRSGIVNFKVRSPKDAHLVLTTGPVESDPMVMREKNHVLFVKYLIFYCLIQKIEIFIGGWENSKSVIRKNKTQPEKAETPTNGILSAGEFRGFWIRWTDGVSCKLNDILWVQLN